MSDNILRKKVLQAVEEQRQKSEQAPLRHPKVLAEFIRLQLTKLPMDEGQLAELIDLPEGQVQMLLQGTLPMSIITEELLQRIANALQCDVKLMQIILDRTDSKQTSAR